MDTNRFIHILICLICCLFSYGNTINHDDAKVIASDFIKCNDSIFNLATESRSPILDLSYTSSQDGNPTFYVFNISSGGYVMISARESMYPVIGYSITDTFDYTLLSKDEKNWFANYSRFIAHRPSNKFLTKQQDKITPIAPLLGNTQWGQLWPYNELCPVISGYHAPTGCVITAYAQIMRYYKWPEQGEGKSSYQWNGETLEVDFSKSKYDWEAMSDTYDENSSDRSILAVATLMRDLGVAFKADYSLSGTGAFTLPEPLNEYFGYSSNTDWMVANYVSSELFESTILQELNVGRPVLISGGNSNHEFHAYVCDGVDQNGYFHINFGWGGNNGYFLLSDNGYSLDMDMWFKIRPEDGTKLPSSPYISLTNHFKYSENINKFKIAVRWFGDIIGTEYIMAIYNIKTKEITYLNSFSITSSETYTNVDVELNDIKDGDYVAYPLYRIRNFDDFDNVSEWKKFEHNTMYQAEVEFHVSNGIVKFVNPLLPDTIEEGTIKIDNLYYKLNNNRTASVTYKNTEYDSYAGDIVIPDFVFYNNEKYDVTSINDKAFLRCSDLRSVTLSNSIKQIELDGLGLTNLQLLRFPKNAQLEKIDNFAIEANSQLISLKLPKGLRSLGVCALQGCYQMQYLSIPETYSISDNDPLHMCTGLKSIRFEDKKPFDADMAFFGVRPDNLTLYVPLTAKSDYQNHIFWGTFPIFEYFSQEDCFYYQTDNGNVVLLDGDMVSGSYEIPTNLNRGDSQDLINVTQIGQCAFYGNNNLEEISIPSSVDFIGEYAFTYCSSLKLISCQASNPPTIEENKTFWGGDPELNWLYSTYHSFYGIDKQNCILQVPKGSKYLYANAPEWSEFQNIIEVDFTAIDDVFSNTDVTVSFGSNEIELFYIGENVSVQIFNISGQLIYEGSDRKITGLSKGIYIVKVNGKYYKGLI